jgi:xylulokinase
LVAGVPLVAGAGDQVAGFVGAGVVDAGECIDVAGTFPVFATCADHFLVDTEYGMFQSLAGPMGDDNWYWMMYIGGGGLTHRWFVEQFGSGLLQSDQPAGQIALCPVGRASAKGARRLRRADSSCPTWVDASAPWIPTQSGAWIGFDWTHTRVPLLPCAAGIDRL